MTKEIELRDYFAGLALTGMLSGQGPLEITQKVYENPDAAAEWSYQYADAMLKARKQSHIEEGEKR